MSKTINTYISALLFTFLIFNCQGQIDSFEYRTPILEASEGWNAINLPLDVFAKTTNNLNDIRIYQKSTNNVESIEQPYILDIEKSEEKQEVQKPKIINSTFRNNLYSYTIELTNKMSLNNILLEFQNTNFDWYIHLEGSMDQNSWSTIVKDYRIVSIVKGEINFSLTDISIPESKFNFYKVTFTADQKPILKNVTIQKKTLTQSKFNLYPIKKVKHDENEKSKTSIIELDLGQRLPVAQLRFSTDYQNDFYRPFKIEGVIDSFETDKGWKYNYELLYKGSINSFSKDVFSFENRIANKLKITIYNFDNQPLSFSNYEVKGPNYRLIARLDDPNNMFLAYGNKNIARPYYDISYFEDKIPENLNLIKLGPTVHYPKSSKVSDPLFKNKWWLWGLMILVILLLGTFTIKMLREEK